MLVMLYLCFYGDHVYISVCIRGIVFGNGCATQLALPRYSLTVRIPKTPMGNLETWASYTTFLFCEFFGLYFSSVLLFYCTVSAFHS